MESSCSTGLAGKIVLKCGYIRMCEVEVEAVPRLSPGRTITKTLGSIRVNPARA